MTGYYLVRAKKTDPQSNLYVTLFVYRYINPVSLSPKKKYQLRIIILSLVVALSFASFAYLNSLDSNATTDNAEMLSEELDEKKNELLPDVHLMKMLMQKTLEFVTKVQPL